MRFASCLSCVRSHSIYHYLKAGIIANVHTNTLTICEWSNCRIKLFMVFYYAYFVGIPLSTAHLQYLNPRFSTRYHYRWQSCRVILCAQFQLLLRGLLLISFLAAQFVRIFTLYFSNNDRKFAGQNAKIISRSNVKISYLDIW